MAVFDVALIARAIEIVEHQADRIKALMAALPLAELDASDLGYRLTPHSGPQWPGKQSLLSEILYKLRVDAGST